MIRELEAGDISLSYEGRSFGNIKPGMAITGQERAMGLLRLGLETDRAGYNIVLSGDDGSGRLNAVLEEIRRIENRISGLKDAAYAYGTPWSGKTPCYRPLSFPVGGMVRLKQASANRFRRQEGANAFVAIYPGCSVIGQDAGLRSHLYDTLVCLAEMVPVGVLECLPDREAALLCHRELLMAES